MKTLNSVVPGHEGECTPTWVNRYKILNRMDDGVSGFFKRVNVDTILGFTFKFRYGNEFHGVIRNGEVHEPKK